MKITSYRSPKTEVKGSQIEGRGLFAKETIKEGEVISIKGGYLIDKETLIRHQAVIDDSELQIADNIFLAPLRREEFDDVMMFLNHCCEPNVGVQGQIVFVAMRDISPGEELLLDYAMIDADSEPMQCTCGAESCRKVITSNDWQKPELQKKYGNFFSWYLLEKMQ